MENLSHRNQIIKEGGKVFPKELVKTKALVVPEPLTDWRNAAIKQTLRAKGAHGCRRISYVHVHGGRESVRREEQMGVNRLKKRIFGAIKNWRKSDLKFLQF